MEAFQETGKRNLHGRLLYYEKMSDSALETVLDTVWQVNGLYKEQADLRVVFTFTPFISGQSFDLNLMVTAVC